MSHSTQDIQYLSFNFLDTMHCDQVVQDVVLTINQAIGPVEKGVTKIQETFYHKSEAEDSDDQEEKVELKVEQHVEENHSESETHVNSGRDVDTK